jgi:hypothetical protein
MKLLKVPPRAVKEFLGDRPFDPRVTYTTGINRSKKYAPNGKRERERRQRQIAAGQIALS